MKKNLVFIVQSLEFGGLEKMVVELANRLNRQKFNVFVCCLFDKTKNDLSPVLSDDVKVAYMKKKPGVSISLFTKIARYLRSVKADIVHTHSSTANLYGTFGALLAGKKLIFNTEHGGIYFETKRKQVFNKILFRLNQKMVCVSNALADDLRMMGVSGKKMIVIPNGFDLEKFTNSIGIEQKRRSLGLDPDDYIIGFVGRLAEVKNPFLLLHAITGLIRAIPELKVIIVGDGQLKKDITVFIEANNLKDYVFLTGFRTDIHEIMPILDCLVNPSVSESFGLSIIEAMAAKVPVIATRVGGVVEIIENHQNGILIESNNKEELMAAITDLYHNKIKAKKIGEQACRDVLLRYSLNKMVQRYENLYVQS